MNQIKQLIDPSDNHTVQICLTENSQVDLVTRYIKDGLLVGEAVFIISKSRLRKILKLKIKALSFDGQPFQDLNQLRFFDAKMLLAYLRTDEGLEEAAFQEYVVDPIKDAQSEYKRVRALGEVCDVLWEQKQYHILVQLISYYKKHLTHIQELSLLHTYSFDQLDLDSYDGALEHICKCHSHLAPQQDDSSTKKSADEGRLNAFDAAWNRVINKLTH